MQINKLTYGHGEMRNKKLKQRKRHYTKDGSSAVPNKSPWKRKGTQKRKKKSYYNKGYSYLVTQPSTNPAQQGLTLLSGQNMFLSLWHSNSYAECLRKISKKRKGIKKRKKLSHTARLGKWRTKDRGI